jgi:hypothetical protein
MNYMYLAARLTTAAFVATLFLSGCDLFSSDNEGDDLAAGRVLVANGGSFSDQNGYLTTYDPETEDAFQGASLNGFVQGMAVHEERIYVLVNTFSVGRVDVLDLESVTPVGTIDGLPAPRSMAVVDGTAYIVNLLFGAPGQVVPVDLETLEPGAPIEMGTGPEGIAALNGRLFVADHGSLGSGSEIFTFEAGTSGVTAVEVPCDGPRDLFAVSSDELVILCTGETEYNEDFSQIISQTAGAALFFDTVSMTTTGRIDVPTQIRSTNETISGYFAAETGTLYALGGDDNLIYLIDIASRSLELVLSVPPADGLTSISGIAYDAGAELLYAGRLPIGIGGEAPDFTSAGAVVTINRSGELVSSFPVGPAPSQIVLLPE